MGLTAYLGHQYFSQIICKCQMAIYLLTVLHLKEQQRYVLDITPVCAHTQETSSITTFAYCSYLANTRSGTFQSRSLLNSCATS